jgi:hypothetical protein
MAATLDIINGAFRKLAIKADDEALTADQVAEGLTALNNMMHSWILYGIEYTHTDIGVDDTFPMAAKFNQVVIYLLARKLSPDYSVAGVDDDEYMRLLRAAFLPNLTASMPSILLNTPSQTEGWVINVET